MPDIEEPGGMADAMINKHFADQPDPFSNKRNLSPKHLPQMVEESKRVTSQKKYCGAVRQLNARTNTEGAIATLIELASATDLGSVSIWAVQTLSDKCSCTFTVIRS